MAAGPIEQLHYTWTPRGVEGINRFQIAAISAGLKSSAMAALMPAIRKVCRYDRPKGEPDRLPVSFGWFDHRKHRIAFSRIGLPRSHGKRGSFAAHVVVASPQLLTEADIASTFGSTFWWVGSTAEELEEIAAGKRDFELPAITVDQLLRDRVESDATPAPSALTLAHGLLTLPGDRRLAVLDEAGEFGPALRTVSRRLPEALEGVSLSTYEGGAPSFPFRVIGTARPTPRSRQCDLASVESLDRGSQRLLGRLLNADSEQDPLRTAARGSVDRDGLARGEALWRAAALLVSLVDEERAIDAAAIRALSDPHAVAYVAREPAGRANLAEALRTEKLPVLRALGAAWQDLDAAGTQAALCEALAERYVATGGLGGIAVVSDAVPGGPARDALLDRIVAAAVGDTELAGSLRADDIARIVGRAARKGMSANAIGTLLSGASGHIGRCAEDATLPQAYLTTMFRAALLDPRNDAALAMALRVRPAMLAGVRLEDEERDRALAFLERLPTARLQDALPGLLPSLADPAHKERIALLVQRLSAGSAGRCIVAAAFIGNSHGSEMPPVLSELCDDQAAALLANGVAPLALDLLTHSRSSAGTAAAPLLRSSIHRSAEPAVSVARRAAEIEHNGLRSGIVERAFGRAVEDAHRPAELNAVWLAMGELYAGAEDSDLLSMLLIHGERSRSATGGAALLAWIARYLLADHSKLLGRGGRLADRRADERARQIAAGVPQPLMAEMQPYLEGVDRRSLAWWKGLMAHSRKQAKRRRR